MSNSLWHEHGKCKYSEELKLGSDIHKDNNLHRKLINALLYFKKTQAVINNIYKDMPATANLFLPFMKDFAPSMYASVISPVWKDDKLGDGAYTAYRSPISMLQVASETLCLLGYINSLSDTKKFIETVCVQK